jgi:hypothetical protein
MILNISGSEVRFRPRPVEGVRLAETVTPEKLILDGQQRLTSLYGAIMSKRPVETQDEKQKAIKRWYYIDMKKCLDPEEDRLDAILSIPEDKCIRSDFGRVIDLDLTTREKEYEAELVPLTLILGADFAHWRIGYMQHYQYSQEHIDRITRFEQDIWMRFQQFKIPVIELLSETPKEAVCQVFEKVNTGGVALSVFELMTATFSADDFQLRKDWDDRKERLHQHDVLKAIDGTEFLQAVTLLVSYKKSRNTGKAPSVKRKDVLNLTLSEYKENADSAEKGLIRGARLLNRQKIFDLQNLPYGTQLIPLGATCAYIGHRFEEENIRQKLVKWYWCGVFGEMYGGANETRYAMDIQDLVGWILDNGDEPRTIRGADFSPMRLLTMQSRRSAAYKGMFALMVQQGSRDFKNGDPIAHTTGFELPVDIHHIFPRAWCRQRGISAQRWNSIINKAPLTSRTNRILSGSAPSRYISRLLRDGAVSEIQLREILSSHWIDFEILISDDFDTFLRERGACLLDAIEVAMGKPIQGRDSEEVIQTFNGPL